MNGPDLAPGELQDVRFFLPHKAMEDRIGRVAVGLRWLAAVVKGIVEDWAG